MPATNRHRGHQFKVQQPRFHSDEDKQRLSCEWNRPLLSVAEAILLNVLEERLDCDLENNFLIVCEGYVNFLLSVMGKVDTTLGRNK